MYVTRAVAARERAGLNRDSTPRAARGVEERAGDVIEVDDNDDWVHADFLMIGPPLTIKVEPEDILTEPEPEPEVLCRGRRKRVHMVQLLPRMKGNYHKAVGFFQAEEDSGSNATNSEETILTTGTEELNSLHADSYDQASTDTRIDSEGEPESSEFEHLSTNASYFGKVRAKRGTNLQGWKDPGVLHPPRNRVKVDQERESVLNMYEGAGYNAQRGVINIEMNKGAPPSRAMTEEECEFHVVGLVLANMYNLRKGTELFGERADEAVLKELTQIDEFETYQPVHKHELLLEDRKKALELTMKITEKRADKTGHRKIKGRMVADGSKQRSYEGYEKSDGSSPTARTDSVIMSGVIDAHERRNVAVIDVENAFLQSDNDQRIIMAIRGKTAELLVRLKPSLYRPYIWYSKKGYQCYMCWQARLCTVCCRPLYCSTGSCERTWKRWDSKSIPMTPASPTKMLTEASAR